MTNREKLLKRAEYDTLTEANHRLRKLLAACSKNGFPLCIMDVLGEVGNPLCNGSQRSSDKACETCIADWLNKEVR